MGILPESAYLSRGQILGRTKAHDFFARFAEVRGEFVARGASLGQQEIVRLARMKGYVLSQSSVSRWINAETTPRIESAEGLAAALGVTPEWLAFGRGQKYEGKPLRSYEPATPLPVSAVVRRDSPEVEERKAKARVRKNRGR